MESIKQQLQKLKCDARERSKHCSFSNSGSGDLGKGSCTASTMLSSDSEGVQRNKNSVSSCEQFQGHLSGQPLKLWKSEQTIDLQSTADLEKRNGNANININNNKSKAALQQNDIVKRPRPRSPLPPLPKRTPAAHTDQQVRHIKINGKDYTILNLLGKGGSSVVYQAFSEYHRQCVAIKYVNLSNADEVVREAYVNEIELLEQLQGSPYVIRMFDYERQRHKLYVVMECGDIDLASFMKKKSDQIDDKFVKYHWQEMLRCVQVIHDKNIVHSDLKPANFLFVGASLKLIDFGIASNIPSNKTSVIKDMQVGTLNFMSPEAISGSYVDSCGSTIYKIPLKSDVWSLGCILYAMVYGCTPFQSITNQMAKLQAISSEKHVIDFPKNKKTRDKLLLDVLKKCLVRDVKKRASIEELLKHPYLNDASLATPSPARIRQMAAH